VCTLNQQDFSSDFPVSQFIADVGKIILKVISDQIKIIFLKNDFKSDQDHIFFLNDLDELTFNIVFLVVDFFYG
jgi:hypothetical protein